MDRIETAKKIEEIITPITNANGADLVRVKLMGHAHNPTVQIMAERADGTMDLGLCETLSREYSMILDVHDLIPTEYVLEVSSPGIDRPLTRPKDFKKWVGYEAIIELHEKLEGRRKFKGILQTPQGEGGQDMVVCMLVDNKSYQINFSFIKEAGLTLSDELLKATKDGTLLHGMPCEDPEVEQEIQ